HKFDAISTKDYYALSGFLKSSRRQEAFLDPDGEILATTEKMEVVKEQADKTLRAEMFKLSRGIQAGWPVFLAAARDAIWPELSDESPENNGSLTERVALIAATRGLDAEALGAWVAALTDEDVAKPSHPMHGWWELSNTTDGNMSERFQQFGKRQQQLVARSLENQEKVPLMTDFSGDDFGDWFVTGDAFGKSPTQSGQWDGQLRRTNLAPAGVLHSGQLAKSHQGVLRSPSFILKHPQILYRLATQQANDASVLGENVQIRVICDSFFMDVHNGLLFEGFAFSPNTKGEWTWHRQAGDIGRYLGHRVHIEILDYGDGWLAVDEIRFSDGELPAEVMSPVVEKLVMGEPIQSRKDLDLAVAGLFRESLKNWSQGAASPAQTDWVRWAVSKKLVEIPAVARESLEIASQQLDDLAESLPSPTRVLAMADGNGQNRALYVRGNHKTLGEKVPRRLLTALGGAQNGIAAQGSGRLQLARQFVDPQNPLLSRVFVNRVWHHLFGRGIVASVDNFGVLGERPSHPQLLDYLAARFVTEGKTLSGEEGFGWSVKSLIREMVLSQTYRMSSRPDASASQVDPANQWLHRQRVRRLQGEVIRDAILAGSGRLDVKMFGSSVPVHVTPFMQGRGHPGSGPLDGEGRRSIFLSVRRNFLSPMMLAFDTPQPFNTQGRRTVSNVPAQALILLNDPFVIDQGKVWARRLLKERETSTRDRIRSLYVQAFGRPPTEEERTSAHEFVQVQSGEYGIELAAAWRDERIWADLCHVVMNTKEFIYLH
ncbi:MAG: DUF1549 and DUF1553 domain-containing protein, partial [Pirellulaceae bacterium]|nr:DUF1549 and DUF1553 domain-containing protein [Pirellulaceae bacterium]